MRSLGPAWVEPDGSDGWRMRRGRVDDGRLTEAQAHEQMLALVREHDADQTVIEQDASARERRGVTFRDVALDYLAWLADVRGAKPSTLRALRSELTEPGIPHRRGTGHTPGWIMGGLGDRPAREVTTREINLLLRKIAATGVSPRTVNKARQLIHAVFNYGMRPHTWGLTENPAKWADRRREPEPGPLPYYSVGQIEALARAFESGAHRDPRAQGVGEEELAARADEDAQGADVESNSTKSGRFREVPLPDQAAGALDRLSRRDSYIGPDEHVFCNRFGRRLDPSALRRRYDGARDAAGLPPLRFHDLRHTYGSLLVAGGVDLISVKSAMGHSQIGTTERYLHARPATELATRFTNTLGGLSTSHEAISKPAA